MRSLARSLARSSVRLEILLDEHFQLHFNACFVLQLAAVFHVNVGDCLEGAADPWTDKTGRQSQASVRRSLVSISIKIRIFFVGA